MPAVVTRDDLAGLLGRPFAASEQARADAVLDIAEAEVQAYCDRVALTQTVDDELVLAGAHRTTDLELPGGPVENVSAVTLDGEPVDGWTLLGDVLVRSTTGQVVWGSPYSLLSIVYTHGYPAGTAPRDIFAAILLVGVRLWEVPAGVRSEQLGAESVTYAPGAEAGLTQQERSLLRRYHRGARTGVFA